MKKILTIAALAAALVFTSCKGGGGTKLSGPEAAVKSAIEAIKKGDVKAFINTYNLSDEEKAALSSLIEDKLQKEVDEKGGVKSYEIIDTDIDGETATVKAKIYYTNGTDEETTFNLKNVDGKWLQEMKK